MISPSRPLSANVAAAAPPPSFEAFQQKRGFDFREFWHSLLERIWIVALCVIAGLFLALGYLARTPKLYEGHTVLEVDFQEPTVMNGDEASRMRSVFLATQEALRTIEQSLTNRSLLARVVRAENLAKDGGRALLGKSVSDPKGNRPSPAPRGSISMNATESASGPSFTPLEEALGGAISAMVKPVVRRGTRLIDLYVRNRDPAMAQRLAEAVGREYIHSSIERRASFSQDALRYLLEEEERLKTNLQKSEAAVAEYKAKTPDALQLGGGAAATGSQSGASNAGPRGGSVEDKLQELSSKLTAAKAERIKLEGELAQVAQAGQDVEALLAIQSIATASIVNDRRHDLAQAEANLAALSQRYKEKHPKMMAARAASKEAQDALRRAVLAQPALMKNGLQQARTTETSLESASGSQEQAALALNKAAIGYQELARQAETDRALYESVLRQIKETNLTKDVKTNAVSVSEHSPLPQFPASPQPVKAIMLGLLGGLVAGMAFVYQAEALDRSVKTVDQAEAVIGLPVLAAVPETKEETRKDGNRQKQTPRRDATYRLVDEDPGGPVAEAFRNLRAALSLLGPEADRRIFLFTSALPNEGKSFASANYALALAQQGYRVLLIDGDLRRPRLDKIFGLSFARPQNGDPPGIVGYLVGQSDVAGAAYPVPPSEIDLVENKIAGTGNTPSAMGGQLDILAGGRRAPNPAETLSGPRFAELLAEASRLYDRVVIDSAPVLAVSDTLLMTPFVQTVCMVLLARKTPRNAVRRAIGLLASAGGRPVGLVLNRLPTGRGAGYYYYYASPGYGAGEGSYAGQYAGHYGDRPTDAAQESTGT
jgi:succinoglycan biosynthesis transport protein ExoP